MIDSIIFDQFQSKFLGKMKNRSVMSPMTRGFADKNHCATNQMSNYYERRAKNGIALIITEGIIIHPSADGYNNVPHLYNDRHIQSWKNITEPLPGALAAGCAVLISWSRPLSRLKKLSQT